MGFFGGGGGAAPADMVGATASVAGTAGLVPAPAAGQEHLMLKGGASGGWIFPPSTELNGSSNYHSFEASALGGFTASGLLNTRLYLFPLIISGAKTFNRIGFRYGSAAGCKARIGLYNSSISNFRPSTLIVDSTELSGSTNTNVEFTISPATTLKNSIYWMVFVPELSTSMNCIGNYNLSFQAYFGSIYSTSLSSQNNRLYVDFTYAALPSDLSTYAIKQEAGQNYPVIWLRNA
jgi:hypothetical protein